MRIGFYPMVAFDGIRKNRKLYIPYILTGSLMVMMYYIMNYLADSETILNASGVGDNLVDILPFGYAVITIFSLIFLFYTNSFLIKQRYREFGLYNVLGMDKRNISIVMMWESIFTAVISIALGLFFGIAFSKAAELVLINMVGGEVNFDLSIGAFALRNAVIIYGGIYLILLAASIIKVRRSKPLELIKSGNVGEKVPKFSFVFGIIGVLMLLAAYILAFRIEEPVTAMATFFVAVVLVIIGTYLIFISGSVAFCRLLSKNKKYYYRADHFVSVSSMTYRMKRNGAGLASICILLTMVLVMISSTASLFFGEEDSLDTRYPNDIMITMYFEDSSRLSSENLSLVREDILESVGGNYELHDFATCGVAGLFTDGGMKLDYRTAGAFSYDNVGYALAVSLEEYNKRTGKNETLSDDECFIWSDRIFKDYEIFTFEEGCSYKVKARLDSFYADPELMVSTSPVLYFVVNDLCAFSEPIYGVVDEYGEQMLTVDCKYSCGFDINDPDREAEVVEKFFDEFVNNNDLEYGLTFLSAYSKQEMREGFFGLYGGLFFIGIVLSVLFLIAAVIIIYYKQICEGYEDSKRFEIMQNVGMTKRDIKRSINSQMMTVFFMPLIFAGMHLAFAFPYISKILVLFAFKNTMLNVAVNVICFVIFGAFYAAVYKITSNTYYSIVSKGEMR